MNMFKALCKCATNNIKENEVVNIGVKKFNTSLSYTVIKDGTCISTMNAIKFHKHFDLIEEELDRYAKVIEEATLDAYEIVEDEEEPNYYSDEYIRGHDIVDAIQYMVQRLQNECFAEESEDGDLQFIVSCLYEEDKDGELSTRKIILTIKHGKWTNSRVLFPGGNMYGFDHLEDIMRSMYNQTM